MKKILLLAMVACLSASAFAQFRVEGGYAKESVSYSDGEANVDINLSGAKLGAYFMINDVIHENVVVEPGLTFQSVIGKQLGIKFTHTTFAIPINAGYIIKTSDVFSVRPYTGVNLKFNCTWKASDDGESVDLLDAGKKRTTDVNKMQFGGQIGAVCQWNNFTLTYQLQTDFSDLYTDEECKFKGSAITVGYIF